MVVCENPRLCERTISLLHGRPIITESDPQRAAERLENSEVDAPCLLVGSIHGRHGLDWIRGLPTQVRQRSPIIMLFDKAMSAPDAEALRRLQVDFRYLPGLTRETLLATLDGAVERRKIRKSLKDTGASPSSEVEALSLLTSLEVACLISVSGFIEWINTSACQIFDCTPADVLGTYVFDYIHPDSIERIAFRVGETLRNNTATLFHEERLIGPRGDIIDAQVQEIPFTLDGRKAILTVIKDQRTEKAVVSKLLGMDRMMALGTLAAGVGHEINNPLAYLISNLEYAIGVLSSQADPADPVELAEVEVALEESLVGARRVGDIVRDLRALISNRSTATEETDLRETIEIAIDLHRNTLQEGVIIHTHFTDAPKVMAVPGKLTQTFFNILGNAISALKDCPRGQGFVRVTLGVVDEKVTVCFEDNGIGIEEDQLHRVFDPFYYHEEPGKVGLGLAIARQTIESFGGKIGIESEYQVGTTVSVSLPATR